jgi:hypothetical protein
MPRQGALGRGLDYSCRVAAQRKALPSQTEWRAYSTGLLLLGVDVVSERRRMGSSDSGHIVPNL